jgi:hypothetical protein
LEKIRIDAARGCEYDFLHLRAECFREDQSIQEKIGCRSGLVQVHIAPAAMVSRKMKHRVHTLHCGPGHTGLAQIGLEKINFAAAEMLPNISKVAARQVIHNADFRAAREQLVGKRRADEGSSPGNQRKFPAPNNFSRRHAWHTSSINFRNFRCSVTLS